MRVAIKRVLFTFSHLKASIIKTTKNKKTMKNQETVTKQLGRPSNPNSARQIKIAERQAKAEAGLLKRGRPVIEGSK